MFQTGVINNIDLVKLARDLTRPKKPNGGDCKGYPRLFQGHGVVGVNDLPTLNLVETGNWWEDLRKGKSP